MIIDRGKGSVCLCVPGSAWELMKSSLLQRRPQVAFTCLALDWWFWGPVITQHSTRTRPSSPAPAP